MRRLRRWRRRQRRRLVVSAASRLARSWSAEAARGDAKTADMPEETMKDLRAVHFSYGFVPTGPSEYTTTSRSQSDAYVDKSKPVNRNPYDRS